jgi:hypothetical protein
LRFARDDKSVGFLVLFWGKAEIPHKRVQDDTSCRLGRGSFAPPMLEIPHFVRDDQLGQLQKEII